MFRSSVRSRSATFAATLAAALLLGLAALTSSATAAGNDVVHLTLVQEKPDIHTDAADPAKPRDGDDATFYADLREGGKRVGHIAVVKVEVRNPADRGANDLAAKHELLRMSLITFSLGGNDAIMAQGVTYDKADGMVTGEPEVRAITGGTGKYEFASGQVVTTREPDGTYRHEIELRTR